MNKPNETLGKLAEGYKRRCSLGESDCEIIDSFLNEIAQSNSGRGRIRVGDIGASEIEKWKLSDCLGSFIKRCWLDREQAAKLLEDFLSAALGGSYFDFSESYEKRAEVFVRMLKYLQEGSHTQEDIADHFSTSTNTIQNYSRDLQRPEGVSIMGKRIKIEELERGTNHYDPSIHPIFLTLNLTEVNALTVILKQFLKEGGPIHRHPFATQLNDIADDVHSQLSDYAAKIIDKNAEVAGVRFSPSKKNSEFRREERQLAYFIKSGAKCSVTCDGFDKPLEGEFTHGCARPGYVCFVIDSGKTYELPYSGISDVHFSE